MKIAMINTVYGRGSVGRITADLYQAVEESKNSALLVYGRGKALGFLGGGESYKVGDRIDFIRHVAYNFWMDGSGFGSSEKTDKLLAWLDIQRPDMLHLHNLHGFYIQVERLFAYIKERRIPVVWTLHDCWPYTGHCIYYDRKECRKWQTGCGECHYHRTAYPYAIFKDNSRENFRRKKAAFCGVERLVIVTPSEWLAGEVQRSMLQEYPVKVIPNGIDLDIFQPKAAYSRVQSREKARFEILGVANIWEERKGLAYLEYLAQELPANYRLTIVGLNKRQRRRLRQRFSEERLRLCGRTDSVEQLAEYYRQASVYVNPTLEDNFPTTNLEAIACGTPVVTFQTGGSPETLDESCGIVVEKANAAALRQAVEQVCAQRSRVDFSEACRQRALLFDKKKRYQEYLALYQEIFTIRK